MNYIHTPYMPYVYVVLHALRVLRRNTRKYVRHTDLQVGGHLRGGVLRHYVPDVPYRGDEPTHEAQHRPGPQSRAALWLPREGEGHPPTGVPLHQGRPAHLRRTLRTLANLGFCVASSIEAKPSSSSVIVLSIMSNTSSWPWPT